MNKRVMDSVLNSSVTYVSCRRFRGDSAHWNYTRHNHPHVELIYHINGRGYRKVNTPAGASDQVQTFSSFDVVVYPAGLWHEDGSLPDSQNEVYCLMAQIPGIELNHPVKIQDKNGDFEYLFREIYQESQRFDSNAQILASLIQVLLIKVLRNEIAAEDSPIDRIIQYINHHATEQFSLQELADREYISLSYLTKHFRRRTGMTVVEYAHHVRVKTAKRLLCTTDMRVEDIAQTLGYESSKYFYRVFRHCEGISPNQYRKSKQCPGP